VAGESKRALPDVRATLTVPLQYEGAVLGLLTAVWTRPHTLGGTDLDVAAALGAHAALAVRAAGVGQPG
jgi:GAF domain-containing protein